MTDEQILAVIAAANDASSPRRDSHATKPRRRAPEFAARVVTEHERSLKLRSSCSTEHAETSTQLGLG